MNKREVLIILNRLKDIAESEKIDEKLTLNQIDATILYKYLLELKRHHEKDVELINQIISLIQKR